MSASVPWSVNAVEEETWAAAREAARRAGMSVGEWLEAAIRENAQDNSAPEEGDGTSPYAASEDRLEDIAQQLDQLIGITPNLTQASQQTVRVNAGVQRSLKALNQRIESLMAGVRTSEPKLPTSLQAAIERLDRRLEALLTVEPAPPRTPPEVERKLADIAHNVDMIRGRMERELQILAEERAFTQPEVERKLADITRSIDGVRNRMDQELQALAKERAAAAHSPDLERKLADIAHSVETIKGRMDRELELLTAERIRAAAAPAPELERKLADIAGSIETIKSQMDQDLQALAAQRAAPVPSPELDSKLTEIVSRLEAMNKRFDDAEHAAPVTPPPSVAEIDAAVAEITMHQSTLEGAEPTAELQRRFAAIQASLEQSRRENQLSELEQQFRTMIDEVAALRRDSAQTEGVETLRKEIAELSERLSDLAPRQSIEALEGAVEALAQRIDQSGTAGNDNLIQIVDALKLIRQALAEVQPAESFAAVERDLQGLSHKLDALGTKGFDRMSVSRLQSEASEIRQVLANALPSDSLQALVEQIELLVSRFEEVSNNGDAAVRDLVGGLERRLESLAGRLESTHGAPSNEALAAIGSRVDALQRAFERGGARADSGLAPMLQSLADKVEDAQVRLGSLDVIERELREVRGTVNHAAGHAARSAVREPAENVPAPKPASRPIPQAESIPPVASRAPALEPAPAPAPAEVHARAAQPAEPPAIENELPADFPLEPGSGSPRSRSAQTAAERVALSEAALGTFAPVRSSAAESRATDFIAAARRAAQAANAETGRAPDTRSGDKGMFAFLNRFNPKTTRKVAIGLAAMLVIYGAVRYYDVVLPLITFSAKSSKVQDVASQAKMSRPEPVAPPLKLTERTEIVPPAKPAETVEIVPPVKPAERTEMVPPVEPQVRVQTREERGFGIPPAGMLASQPPPAPPPAAPVIEQEETGAITPPPTPPQPPARLTVAPPAAVFAGAPGELPAGIGPASLRNAAFAGDPAAAYEIGARWFEGRGVAPSGEQAQRWFEQAIAKGSMHAAYRLGSMHEKGQGIPKNLNEARRLYLIAAEAGHAKAMHNLAVLHAEGIDGRPDMRASARWFRLAADRGVRDSQYNLGVMYARGAGVTQNLAESYRWFAIAAMQGDTEAAKKRDDVGARLDPQSLIAAKLAVQTWTASPLDPAVNDVAIKPEWQKAAEAAPGPRKRPAKN
jgi:localization factor PodJL